MISETAWANVAWIKKHVFDDWARTGGVLVAIESVKSLHSKEWLTAKNRRLADRQILIECKEWAQLAGRELLYLPHYFPGTTEVVALQPRFGDEFTKQYWFLNRAYQNLYCLTYFRKTIEELIFEAIKYRKRTRKVTETQRKQAIAAMSILLKLNKSFLLAEWFQDLAFKAIANRDKEFFGSLSRGVKASLLDKPSPQAKQWLLVVLLWYLGGRDYPNRRLFLLDLQQKGYLSKRIGEEDLNTYLFRFGLTRT